MSFLKLIAMDEDDLEIISAHMQDAVLRVGDMQWLAQSHRFALVANRYAWEENVAGSLIKRSRTKERHQCGLHFDYVLKVDSKGINHKKSEDVLSLLTIQYQQRQEPEGFITLLFAGEAAIRLHVECIEAAMADLGPVWQAHSKPKHD